MRVQPSDALPKIMLARYYGANVLRFLSVDPSPGNAQLSDPQSWNRYTYTGNNPMRFVDPDGRDFRLSPALRNITVVGYAKSATLRREFEKAKGNSSIKNPLLMPGAPPSGADAGGHGKFDRKLIIANDERQYEVSGGPIYIGPGTEHGVISKIGHELAELNALAEELGGNAQHKAHKLAQDLETKIQRELLDDSDDIDMAVAEEKVDEVVEESPDEKGEANEYGIDPDGLFGPQSNPCSRNSPLCGG